MHAILETPFFPICRNAVGRAGPRRRGRLAEEIRGVHWMVCYGDYLRELATPSRRLAWIGWR